MTLIQRPFWLIAPEKTTMIFLFGWSSLKPFPGSKAAFRTQLKGFNYSDLILSLPNGKSVPI